MSIKNLPGVLLLCLILSAGAFGQQKPPRIITSDIDRFWVAYDSIRTTTDSLRQVRYLTQLYLDKGTPGLKAFVEVKEYTAGEWVHSIRHYPRFWNSIRPRTLLAKSGAKGIGPYLVKLKALYPALRPASLYFTIGALRSGGTTQDSLVLIGAEMATGNPAVDISEFPENTQTFLARYFKTDPFQNFIPLNVHEYVHTQINHYGNNVLGQAIYEGTCDLVTELVTGKTMPLPYMTYGKQNEAQLKQRFKTEMFWPSFRKWFYNPTSDDPKHVADLGYYMGYAICKAYYGRASNKQQAIREMIELDYTSNQAVEAFLKKSGYYANESIVELKAAYERKRPVVIGIRPFAANDQNVSASLTEITVDFSLPMAPYTSIDYGPSGKETWPALKKVGFSADKKSLVFKVALQPDHAYEFTVNEGGFESVAGHPLSKPYLVKFRTSK